MDIKILALDGFPPPQAEALVSLFPDFDVRVIADHNIPTAVERIHPDMVLLGCKWEDDAPGYLLRDDIKGALRTARNGGHAAGGPLIDPMYLVVTSSDSKGSQHLQRQRTEFRREVMELGAVEAVVFPRTHLLRPLFRTIVLHTLGIST